MGWSKRQLLITSAGLCSLQNRVNHLGDITMMLIEHCSHPTTYNTEKMIIIKHYLWIVTTITEVVLPLTIKDLETCLSIIQLAQLFWLCQTIGIILSKIITNKSLIIELFSIKVYSAENTLNMMYSAENTHHHHESPWLSSAQQLLPPCLQESCQYQGQMRQHHWVH